MPCSSVSSRTMLVARSALHSRAARAAGSTAPGTPKTSPAIHFASGSTRSALSQERPEALVERHRRQPRAMPLERMARDPTSQKKRASRSRAVSTRSRLRATSSGFSGSMFSTARNAGIIAPWADTSGKKCWWWIIVVASTSSGRPRNSSAKLPDTTAGYSTRSGTSCSACWPEGDIQTRPPRRRASASSSRPMRS